MRRKTTLFLTNAGYFLILFLAVKFFFFSGVALIASENLPRGVFFLVVCVVVWVFATAGFAGLLRRLSPDALLNLAEYDPRAMNLFRGKSAGGSATENLDKTSFIETVAHEAGHVFGLSDAYKEERKGMPGADENIYQNDIMRVALSAANPSTYRSG